MKLSIYTVLLAITIGFTQCCKEKPTSSNNNDIPGLPPATQTGANTLGFLLNGVPWTPAGNNGTANLSMDFDPGINDGIFGIAAYHANPADISSIAFGIRDSLNHAVVPQMYSIGKISLGGLIFRDKFLCERDSDDSLIHTKGSILINRLDRTNGIISGTFECTLFNPSCGDTIKITKGRFDLKF